MEWFKYAKTQDNVTGTIRPYPIDVPYLRYLIWVCTTKPLVIVLKAKQLRVSWTLGGIALYECYKRGANVLEISSGQPQANSLLEKSLIIHNFLPPELQLTMKPPAQDKLVFVQPNSRITALPSTEKAGIGETSTLAIYDEHEFHEYAERNYATILATVGAKPRMIVVSTGDPFQPNSNFKKLWYGAKAGENGFFPIFLPWYTREERDRKWYNQMEIASPDKVIFKADNPTTEEDALRLIEGVSIFDATVIKRLIDEAQPPRETRLGCVYVYHPPRVGKVYAGIDVAEGRGGDYSVLWVECEEGLTREVMVIARTNKMTADVFGGLCFDILCEFHKPFVVAQDDVLGQQVLTTLLTLGYPKDKIYFQDKEKPGRQASRSFREKDIREFEKTIREGLVVKYKPAISEMFTMQHKESGKIEHADGSHDDCVLAGAMANFARTQFREQKYILKSIDFLARRR